MAIQTATPGLGNSEYASQPAKLWNRGYGADRLAMEIAHAQHAQHAIGYRFSIVLVQFDGLSRATGLGHASGDTVWRRVLGVLTSDVGGRDLCCRLGEDEFLLVLTERTEAECRALVGRLRQRWSYLPSLREGPFEMSVGVASYPAQGSTVEKLFAAVDEAMYADKIRNQPVEELDRVQSRAA